MNEIPNLIGFSEAKSGDLSFQTFNPFLNKNNKELYKVATRDEIEKSLELAEEAFYKSHLYSKNKAEFLSQISIELNKSKTLGFLKGYEKTDNSSPSFGINFYSRFCL